MARPYRPRKRWTPADLERLVARYPFVPTPTLAAEWGRPAASIRSKAEELRIRKNRLPAPNALPIGSERVTNGGYLTRKVSNTGNWRTDWVIAHHLVWTAAHGPIPDGFVVTFKDGNRFNVGLENLELSTSSEVFKRHWFEKYPPELRDVIRLHAQLKRKVDEHDSGPSATPVSSDGVTEGRQRPC
ncbi:HNH endonuclease signature motif containing protein [Paraburkholderia solisilvae]|uniref:HNH endonuclease signature motif containing protein n=1 Tax=Paraburkholderia solisilvae TaxID=624376 RepID=UPI0035E739F3